MEEKELQVVETATAADLRKTSAEVFCSMKASTPEQKAVVFNAANAPGHRVSDYINKVIYVKDIYVETISLLDEETGELTQSPRIVFIDPKGEAYQCVSVGMFSALRKLIAAFGEPTWEEPIPILIRQQAVKNGSMLTFEVKY